MQTIVISPILTIAEIWEIFDRYSDTKKIASMQNINSVLAKV